MGLKSKCSIYDKISFLNPRFDGFRKSKESEDSQIKLKDKVDLYVGTKSGDSCKKSGREARGFIVPRLFLLKD